MGGVLIPSRVRCGGKGFPMKEMKENTQNVKRRWPFIALAVACIVMMVVFVAFIGLRGTNKPDRGSENVAVTDESTTPARRAQEEFTPESLAAYIKGESDIVQVLGKGSVTGDGYVKLKPMAGISPDSDPMPAHEYAVTYMCRQDEPGSYSLSLSRAGSSADRRLIMIEYCATGIDTVSLPSDLYPDATDLHVETTDDTTVVLVVTERSA